MQERHDTPAAALRTAAWNGNETIVRHLMAESVDLNGWDRWGRNAPTLAAQAGHLEIAKILIEAGAWVDPFEDYDRFMTPLMCAAQSGNIAIVELLLEHGADPTLHGGVAGQTAENLARTDAPNGLFLAAILRRAEDEWRRASR